jgi:aspartate aminotransferase
MTCGAGGALNVALKTILNPGEEVIMLTPFFVEYKFYIDNHGGVPVEAWTEKETFQLNLTAIENAITAKTRALIICSPNNPTGVIYSEAVLRDLESVLQRADHAIMVISDEPYKTIVYDGVKCPEMAAIISNCIITTSWSKKWGLAGERIGYLAISPKIAEADALAAACTFTNRILGYINAPAIWQLVVAEAPDENTDLSIFRKSAS